ncbi:MAG: ATP-dependent dethiobiotin synthetase BioD [Candidatus Binatia bacterium]|nr:MAG: ATP-dependent dethiobiotin synthetase BioD [Candidatus Binatia bacterium]
MASAFFVTGTDTGVGKTFLGCALLALLEARGRKCAPLKVAETGCRTSPAGLFPSDAALLRYFSRCTAALETVCPYRFEEPLAPWVAARRRGGDVELPRIRQAFETLAAEAEFVLVEGAGGFLVPLGTGSTMADLCRHWRLPVLLVVGSKLGALNHTLLTVEAIERRGLPFLGYVVNFPEPGRDLAAETNVGVLRELLGSPLGVLPRAPFPLEDREEIREKLVQFAREHLDVEAFLDRLAR